MLSFFDKVTSTFCSGGYCAEFHKVSFEQFKESVINCGFNYDEETIRNLYDNIKLPHRATAGSAGYDFYFPCETTTLKVGDNIKFPTGIRCKMLSNTVLLMYPRSGHGFKYGIHLANTVGVIDSDYYYSDNEGHIFSNIVNDSAIGKDMTINNGEAIMQGVLMNYGTAYGDYTDGVRNGGFGSTDNG